MRSTDLLAALITGVVMGWAVIGESWAPDGDALVACGLVALFAVWVLVGDVRMDLFEKAVLGTAAWGGISALAASESPLASKVILGWWSVALGVLLVVRRVGAKGQRATEAVVGGVGVIGAVIVVLECVGLGMFKASGFLVNGNLAAGILCASALVVLTSDRLGRLHLVAGLTMLAGVAATGSRAAGLAVLASAATMIWARPRWRGVVTAVVVVFVAVITWRVVYSSGSLAWHRWHIWNAVFGLISEHPLFGIGAGPLADATGALRLIHAESVGRYGRIIGSAESSYLGLLVRIGLPVTLPLGVGLWSLVGQLRQRCAERLPLLVGLAVFVVFHDVLSEPAVLLVFAVVLGVASPRPSRIESVGWGRRAWGLIAVWFVGWAVAQPAVAGARWLRGPRDAEAVVRAVRAEPWSVDPLVDRIRTLLASEETWTWETAAEALALSDRLVEVAPGRAAAWSLRGAATERVGRDLAVLMGMVSRVRESYERSVELEPHLPWDRMAWAVFERSLGETVRARQLATGAVGEEPNLAYGWAFLAQLEQDEGDPANALRHTERALRIIEDHRFEVLPAYDRAMLDLPPVARKALAEAAP